MNLTTENKASIDARSYEGLLSHCRSALINQPLLDGALVISHIRLEQVARLFQNTKRHLENK